MVENCAACLIQKKIEEKLRVVHRSEFCSTFYREEAKITDYRFLWRIWWRWWWGWWWWIIEITSSREFITTVRALLPRVLKVVLWLGFVQHQLLCSRQRSIKKEAAVFELFCVFTVHVQRECVERVVLYCYCWQKKWVVHKYNRKWVGFRKICRCATDETRTKRTRTNRREKKKAKQKWFRGCCVEKLNIQLSLCALFEGVTLLTIQLLRRVLVLQLIRKVQSSMISSYWGNKNSTQSTIRKCESIYTKRNQSTQR